jgi:hypothetical protein
MLAKHPDPTPMQPVLLECIDACFACAQVCRACADACLAEEDVRDMRQCIRLDLDCAALCQALAEIAARRTGYNEAVIRLTLEACSQACRDCAMECGKHADHHEHCAMCRDACLACAKACDEVATTIWPPRPETIGDAIGA